MQSDMYSKFAEKYDSATQKNIYNAHFERPSLQKLMGPVSGLDVLDLGCGSGIYAQYLIEKGAKKITCLDISEAMINIVRKKLDHKVKAYRQDLSEGLPQESSESADLIICPLVIHYLEDLNSFFKEITRVLKPGAAIVFSTHHPMLDFELSKTGNYFEQELIHDTWDTIGRPVEVSFYRRSLNDITKAVTDNNLVISQMNEGQVLPEVKDISPQAYARLTTMPNFIFSRCQKL